MPRQFDYTTQARGFALRYPLLTHVSIQMNFWVIAFILLATIMHLNGRLFVETYELDIPLVYLPAFFGAIIGGVIYGGVLGLVDWKLEQRVNPKLSLGWVIVVRSLIYFVVLVGLVAFIRYIFWERIMIVYFYDPSLNTFTDESWWYVFLMFGIFCLFMAPAISFINQMNKKFGPGVLIPMLLGRYRDPIEQERLFMLLDLKSSTTIAEKLGHVTYSSLIQDGFLDINTVLFEYRAEIYQYVGDEIVVSWLKTRHLEDKICLEFFFACQNQFKERQEYYESTYGLVPEFKAGAHRGVVTAVEVGEIKREIAYHGDTLNTAARIQSMCNEMNASLLISERLASSVDEPESYHIEPVGEVALKGKSEPSRIFKVERTS